MLIDRRCLGLAELYEKLLKYCVLQDFVCMNWLVLCEVKGPKFRETTWGLIYQDDN